VLDAAGFPKAIVIGLSFGGQRAQALLQHRAERVAGLVLVASGAPDRARARALARRRWLWCLLPKAARLRRQRLLASDLDGAAQAEAFATFHGGVAVIELGADAVIAPAEAARVRSLFPQSRIARVPALTHDAVTSAPPELLAAVLAALDSLQNR
jgi:pimeloyl-ACP methyl ester carboxylesterase